MRFFILLCALCLLMACQPEQKLLTVEDLHFPIDPERDALRENGIREVIEVCVSEGGCHPRSDETGHDTILRISHLDTLGNLILEDPENMFGALTEKHAYNHLGWEVVDYEYNDHHFFYLYSFFPKSNRLVQYLYYYQGFYITIWQFDKDGKPEYNFDAYSHTTFTYDELGRIVSTKKVIDPISVALHPKHTPAIIQTDYNYHGHSNLLSYKQYQLLDTAMVPMWRSYQIVFDDKGLAYERFEKDGLTTKYRYSKTNSLKGPLNMRFLPEPWLTIYNNPKP